MESNAANTPDTPAETAPQPSALERRVDLSLSVADLEKEVEQQLRKIGKTVNIPVRAWATGQPVNFVYEPAQGVAA